ncbi:uncharacterized protein [Penaeus vannamei]|uniref:uncharacterized protein isoform X1 n=1 Tax=Penaeus vannamei TaxID=6689 RepID=UPI00387F3997
MYTRISNSNMNSGRDSYSRNMDGGGERWSQQLENSQDWGTQLFCSQDSQRHQHRTPHSFLMSSSQGAPPRVSGGPGRGGSGAPTPPPSEAKDLTLARDIRFGLHTIISVMRDLPDQLREISGQVSRSSQQPEETNRVVRETSERLQALVEGLEAKLTLLLENKENLEGVRQAVLQNGEQVALLVRNLDEGAERDERRAEEQARLGSLLEATKKEVRKELKKLREVFRDAESSKGTGASLTNMEKDITQLNEKMKDSFAQLHSAFTQQYKSSGVHLEQFFSQTTKEMQQVQAAMTNLSDKLGSLSREIGVQVQQAVKEALLQSPMAGAGNFISPVQRAFSGPRPMLPFAESVYRSQVSPVAQVHPQRAPVAPPPQDQDGKPAPRMTQPPAQATTHPGGVPEPRKTSGKQEAKARGRQTRLSQEHPRDDAASSQGRPNRKVESGVFFAARDGVDIAGTEDPAALLRSRLEDSTQRFTPEKTFLLTDSPGQDTLILEYDSSSSGDSPVLVRKVGNQRSDDWIEQSVSEAARPEAPSRKEPTTRPRPHRGIYLGGGCEKAGIVSGHHPQDALAVFTVPEDPPSGKRKRGAERDDKESCYLFTPVANSSSRIRRFLTPHEDHGLKLKLARRSKKATV